MKDNYLEPFNITAPHVDTFRVMNYLKNSIGWRLLTDDDAIILPFAACTEYISSAAGRWELSDANPDQKTKYGRNNFTHCSCDERIEGFSELDILVRGAAVDDFTPRCQFCSSLEYLSRAYVSAVDGKLWPSELIMWDIAYCLECDCPPEFVNCLFRRIKKIVKAYSGKKYFQFYCHASSDVINNHQFNDVNTLHTYRAIVNESI